MMRTWILLITVAVVAAARNSRILDQKSLLHRLPPPGKIQGRMSRASWDTIEQKLDHFDPTNNATWKMRYISNDEHFQKGGPIFVMIGGEWTINSGYVLSGQMFEAAKRHSGALFYTEHRFYGKSQPGADLGVSNLKYLSADQALADLAYFLSFQRNRLDSDKVVVFGGSYAGNLATWIRLKYPHLVQGAIASSGPVRAKSDFFEYLEVVNDAIWFMDTECVDIIKNATTEMESMFLTMEGTHKINEIYNLCTPIDNTDTKSTSLFFELVADTFAGVVQYAQKDDIPNACRVLKSKDGTPVEKLAAYISQSSCMDANYKSYVDDLKDETVTGYSAMRQWTYQTCTEYGYFQSSVSENQPFGTSFPHQFFIDLCRDIYGEKFSEQLHENGVERTNIIYGGDAPDVTNVIFTNGNVDPWHRLSVLTDLNLASPAIFINGSSHCADLSATNPDDIEELAAAKRRVQETIDEWLA